MFGEVAVPVPILVFATLGLLIGCVYLWRYFIARAKQNAPAKTTPPESAPMASAAPPAPALPVSQELSGEVIAAISAAIACVMETPYIITSVSPAAATATATQPGVPAAPTRRRPVWGFAGMQQNTRPF